MGPNPTIGGLVRRKLATDIQGRDHVMLEAESRVSQLQVKEE